jgi:hypothetical protein
LADGLRILQKYKMNRCFFLIKLMSWRVYSEAMQRRSRSADVHTAAQGGRDSR